MTIPASSLSFPSTINSALTGVQRGINQVERAAVPISNGEMDPQNTVDLIVGQRTMEMNLKVLQTADEMLGSLLNVKA